jgi:hypothetical protein
MKEIAATEKIGPGLFSDDTLELQFNFADGARLEVELIATTPDVIVELTKKGVKFSEFKSDVEAAENFTKLFNRICVKAKYLRPDGTDQPLVGKFKDRIIQLPGVMASIIDESRKHGVEVEQADEGNSES